jgi:hypothetical protein
MDFMPMLSTFFTVSAMALSSTARNSSALISPDFQQWRASFTSGVRNKLPTWSARKGGLSFFILCNRYIISYTFPTIKKKQLCYSVKVFFKTYPAFARSELLLGQIKHFREISASCTTAWFYVAGILFHISMPAI